MRHSMFLFGALFALLSLSACQSDPEGDIWPLVTDCDLHEQTCVSQSQSAQVQLTLMPQPIPIAKPLSVKAHLSGLDAHKVELDISGINMYMGYNRTRLQADAERPGVFNGTAMLAFCTNEVMLWQVTLLVHHADGQITQIPFQLETRNR